MPVKSDFSMTMPLDGTCSLTAENAVSPEGLTGAISVETVWARALFPCLLCEPARVKNCCRWRRFLARHLAQPAVDSSRDDDTKNKTSPT
jgi:hypothetical protein